MVRQNSNFTGRTVYIAISLSGLYALPTPTKKAEMQEDSQRRGVIGTRLKPVEGGRGFPVVVVEEADEDLRVSAKAERLEEEGV